eukprot:6942939-Lingulodinium_polyedra.AAC.1
MARARGAAVVGTEREEVPALSDLLEDIAVGHRFWRLCGCALVFFHPLARGLLCCRPPLARSGCE